MIHSLIAILYSNESIMHHSVIDCRYVEWHTPHILSVAPTAPPGSGMQWPGGRRREPRLQRAGPGMCSPPPDDSLHEKAQHCQGRPRRHSPMLPPPG